MVNILITGDSFAADWTIKYKNYGVGWPNIIAKTHNVTNIAQAGCSEYKILKQLQSVQLSNFDIVIVSHTSPYRLYTPEHPLHKNDKLHHASDLMYTDLLYHYQTTNNKDIKTLIEYFEKYFDIEYAKYVYSLIFNEIRNLCNDKTIHISHINLSDMINDINVTEINMFREDNRGLINHYNQKTNNWIAEFLLGEINKKL